MPSMEHDCTFKKYCLSDPSESCTLIRAVLVQLEFPKLQASRTRLPNGSTDLSKHLSTEDIVSRLTFDDPFIKWESPINIRDDLSDTALVLRHAARSYVHGLRDTPSLMPAQRLWSWQQRLKLHTILVILKLQLPAVPPLVPRLSA